MRRWRSAAPLAVMLAATTCAPRPDADGTGLRVDGIRPGHAAARAGLREGDVLAVGSLPELAGLARRSYAGEDIRVTRVRPTRDELSLPKADWGLDARPRLPESPEGAAFLHLRRAQGLLRAGSRDAARASGASALESARGGGPALEAWAWEAWGDALHRANEQALADAAYESALGRTDAADALARALLFHKRATAAFRRNRFDESKTWALQAHALWEEVAPRSHAAAATLLTLARIERNHGRHDEALRRVDQALAAARDVDPGGPAEAAALSEYGAIAYRRGRRDEEERWQRRALEVYERLGARDADVGRVHVFLGNAAFSRSDVAAAEHHYRLGLGMFEEESPGSLQVGWAVLGLGDVLMARGDRDGAEDAYRRSVAIRAALVPGAPDHALSLQNLGLALRARGDLAGAERAFRDGLGILERALPADLDHAILLANLGEVLAARGRFKEARDLLGRSLRLLERESAGGPEHADSLFALGAIEERAGRPVEAERAYRSALAIRSRLAGGGAGEAEALFAIGVLERGDGRATQAMATLGRAVSALEAQRRRLGGTPEDGARFGATYAHVHKELLDLLLEKGRHEEAFFLLERYRVGSLGTMLARRALFRRAGALEDVRPPGVAEAARALGEGTLLLSFAVLRERTVLFAVAGGTSAPRLEVHVLPVAEARLRADVETLRDLLQSPRAPAAGRAALRRRLRALHVALLGPVDHLVARSRRLLLLPDGPLHLVPFGALVTGDGEPVRYLAQDRPVTRAQAVTLLAAREKAGTGGGRRLVAFGDPAPTGEMPLPQARAEVEALARLYAPEAHVFVGADASEDRAKRLTGDARFVHFASHGRTNDRFPLDSYLALSASSGGAAPEDGRLHSWEVCEQMTLGADLIVLSACDTGLGLELAGAGLVGLTYAFQHAGARAVLASLWSVSDRSTAALMRAFHDRLRQGADPAEALRAAQLQLLAAPLPSDARLAGGWRRLLGVPRPEDLPLDAAHPYYWAAFQLFGGT